MKVFVKTGLAVTMLVACLGWSFAQADVFIKEKFHSDGMTMMGQTQPASDRIQTTWITKDKIRTDDGEHSSILRMENNKIMIYMLDNAKKTYMENPMGSEDMQEMASEMAKESKMKVTTTDEAKKIGSWNCRKYLQEVEMGGMQIKSEVWATEDIKMPYRETYEKLFTEMHGKQSGMKASMEAIEQEAKKIKGVRVLTVSSTTMMKNTTVRSSQELLEVKEGTAPQGAFDIPADYTKQSMPQRNMGPRMPGKKKP